MRDAALSRTRVVFRHPLTIRVAHWINVVAMTVLLLSGLQIFNAHPELDLGSTSSFGAHPILAIGATGDPRDRGYVQAFGRRLYTTGVLGLSRVDGQPTERAFPAWITLPAEQDLATGRRWHFLFAWIFVANGLVYLAIGLLSGRLRRRLIPTGAELRGIGVSLREHLTLRFPKGEEATRYNVIQKLAYLIVVLALLPLQILAGLAMSPGFDAVAPWLPEAFGGRQSARSVHFVIAMLLVLFVFVHLAMVLLTGPINQMRGMITGWFAIRTQKEA
ncbi:MAG TPA: cytochrome b/b6 domain-containing protein [Roseiarcus sp.]|nr:cytochrome b/b6 domain-containing protein [Roseiarcus sp.]